MAVQTQDIVDSRVGKEDQSPFRKWLLLNRRAITSIGFLLVLVLVFAIADPEQFTDFRTYRAIMISLPVSIFLVVPLTFVVTSGEIDLAFPGTLGLSSYFFAFLVEGGTDPIIGLLVAVLVGLLIGAINGALVVYFNLSSLIATLGMGFLLRGIINIRVEGFSIAMPDLRKTVFADVLTGSTFLDIPNQMLWAIVFVIVGWFLFNRHTFGARVHCVGDNPDSATEMGINVKQVRMAAFAFVGVGAALAGVFSVMINYVWWPTQGEGLLLPVLAGIFVGGTPSWGGIGTVVGGAFGAAIVAIIEPGIIAVGLTGFYTRFFYGLTIILSLIGHRFNGRRHR